MPEKDWLTGSGAQGWRGPWGTTYATNLRINDNAMGEDGWLAYMIRETTDEDLRAMHAYIKQLGPAGAPAQPYLPPDQEPKPPYIQYPAPK